MLTSPKYAAVLKKAYDALPIDKQDYFAPVVASVEKDAEYFKLDQNGKYALAWIKLWMKQYNGQTDDGPICNILISSSAKDKCGLLVYSKV